MARQLTLNRVVMYAVGFFLVGILFPIGLAEIYAVNTSAPTTAWNASLVTIFQVVLPILAIMGVAIDYIRGPA